VYTIPAAPPGYNAVLMETPDRKPLARQILLAALTLLVSACLVLSLATALGAALLLFGE
jgi:hypothetical protein